MSETTAENQPERLIVKNFGPLKDVNIELKDIMVFIGPQASGKSTLAKTLLMIFSEYHKVTRGDTAVKEHEKFLADANIDFLTKDTKIEFLRNGGSIYRLDGNHPLVSYPKLNADLETKEKVKQLLEKQEVKLDSRIDILTYVKILSPNILTPIKAELELLLGRLSINPAYIPAERNIISNLSDSIMGVLAKGVSIPKFILDFGGKFEDARNELKKTSIDFLNITYEYNFATGNRIFISPKQSISLAEAASGMQSVIPLYLVVKHFAKSDLLVIEEPELNLFPEAQKKLVEFIIEACRDKTKTLIITTHSPYILTVLNNLIQAHNVVKERPELEEEVNKIIPKERWLDFDKVGVYYVADGTAKNIMYEKNRIIKAENLDSVSKNLSNEFGQLLDLQYGD